MLLKNIDVSNIQLNRLSIRVRILYIGIPVLIVAVILIMGTIVIRNIADDSARRLSRQYSIEAASSFQISTSPHSVLMQQLSRSTVIARWIANEDDIYLRNIAFYEILGYARFLPDAHLMFTVYESLQAYDFDISLAAIDFIPWGQLAGGDVSQWFFDTRDAVQPFILNIQRTRPVDEEFYMYVWSNSRIYYNNEFVGVVTVGSPFAGVFEAVFGHYNINYKRGYVIDNNGMVRVDSAEHLEVFYDGLPAFSDLPEALDNPMLSEYINRHLELMQDGIFQPGAHYPVDPIRVRGTYIYAGIAPIIGTNWSVIVLSNPTGVFGDDGYVTLIIVSLAVLITAVLTGFIMMRNMVLMPLFRLNKSAAESGAGNENTELYGLEREDEIGDLARTIKEAQEVLKYKEADKRAKILIDSSPVACFLLDNERRAVDCNQAALYLFVKKIGDKEFEPRLKNGSSESRNIRDFLTEDFNKIFADYEQEEFKNLLDSYYGEADEKGIKRFESDVATLYGQILPCEITVVPVRYKGGRGYAAYIRDLYDEKRREAAEEESRAKTRFLAKMSHEVRTPMNSVLGITEIQLNKGGHPSDTEEAFLRIFSSSKLLLGIINDILDLSKVEAGKMEIVPSYYETASMIADTAQLNLMYIGSKRINFSLEVDENLPLFLNGDELRIKQILNNILSNAFKFTEEGEVKLSFGAEYGKDSDEIVLVISVTDTGRGISREDAEKLFDTEYAGYNSESNRYIEGGGLGMPISRSLLKLMGGDISLESEVEKGSTFTVRIPQKREGEEVLGKAAVENLKVLDSSQRYLRKLLLQNREVMPYGKVLVVDDMETNLYVVKGLLDPYRITVHTALSGEEAINKIKNESLVYDIIFMDHMMPNMDGIETTKALQDIGYIQPIVALTANATTGAAQMFLSKGFADFISKPIDPVKLDACLMEFIHYKQPADVIKKAREAYPVPVEGEENKISIRLIDSFLTDAKKTIAELEPLIQKPEMNAGDCKRFTLQTHAMKSALANIGRDELSAEAAKLEQAGRVGDLNTIKNNADSFVEHIKDIIEELSQRDEADLPENDKDPVFVKEHVAAISAACETFDKRSAKKLLATLREQAISGKTVKLLADIENHLLLSNFEEAAQMAKLAAEDI